MMIGRIGAKGPAWVFLVLFLLFTACGEHVVDDPNSGDPGGGTGGLVVEDPFDFNTTQDITLRLRAYDNSGAPIQGIRFDVFDEAPNAIGEPGEMLFSGATNGIGKLDATLQLPASLQSVFVKAQIIGYLNQVTVPIANGQIAWTLGESLGKNESIPKTGNGSLHSPQVNYTYLGEWYALGVPKYLESQRDIISAQLLSDISASLPESQPVPVHHPEYIADGTQSNIVTSGAVDLWVTFVHEGAGYKNALGYYVYDTGSAPANESQIDTLFIMFPNFSYDGGGGGLVSGDKVYLGSFPAGKEIAWFIVANGWDPGTETVGSGLNIFYSDPDLNPGDGGSSNRLYNVVLFDPNSERIIVGFEDLVRNVGDDDFNDAMFYVTASDIDSIIIGDIPIIDTPSDCDGDGVSDYSDDFPCDPLRAFKLPPVAGTVAFDDDWPVMGDFDYNDLVVDYSSTQVTNADNNVRDILIDFVLRANGSEKQNGFGFQLPDVLPEAVSNVSGLQLTAGYITLDGKNLEAGQSKPTIIVFDNIFDLMPVAGTGDFINTQRGVTPAPYDTVAITITFDYGVDRSDVGDAPYNPFIIIDGERGRELHGKGKEPTDLVDASYFNTEDDKTNVISGNYYYMQNNLTWALEVPESWDYPFEAVDVDNAYNHWRPWVKSSGVSHSDWYKGLTGYRQEDKIYYPYGVGKH